jgi:hypothetical protein
MDDAAKTLLKHLKHCLQLADKAPTEEIRTRLLNVASLYEREAKLLGASEAHISESRELIAKAEALLAPQCPPREAPIQ